jgi:hypothetical protein
MDTEHKIELVELKPVQPFCGSYKCALSEADTVDEGFAERDGIIIKERVPRKRYHGAVAIERQASPEEQQLWKDGRLPAKFEMSDDGRFLKELPAQPTVMVPVDVANSLVERGLAVRVASPGFKTSPNL